MKAAQLANVPPGLALAVLGALALLVYAETKRAAGQSLAGALGTAAGAAAVDLAAGAVLGVGDAVGIPRTDPTECEKAIAEGRWWDASFACPAGDFIGAALAPRNRLRGDP